MVKIRTYDIFITDNDKIVFGNNNDSELFWDNSISDMRLTTTISGVYPIEASHLATKYYVDQGDIDTFLELTDTPIVYSGSSLKFVRVNEDESGLHFENAIVGVTSSGTTPPEDSNLWYNTNYNEFFYLDPIRDEWLSLTVHNYLFSYQGNIDGFYMSIGDVRHSYAHYLMPRPATITGIISAAQQVNNPSKTFEIRDDGATISGATFTHSSWSYTNMSYNISVPEGAKLQMFVTSGGLGIRNPVATLEVRWRYVS